MRAPSKALIKACLEALEEGDHGIPFPITEVTGATHGAVLGPIEHLVEGRGRAVMEVRGRCGNAIERPGAHGTTEDLMDLIIGVDLGMIFVAVAGGACGPVTVEEGPALRNQCRLLPPVLSVYLGRTVDEGSDRIDRPLIDFGATHPILARRQNLISNGGHVVEPRDGLRATDVTGEGWRAAAETIIELPGQAIVPAIEVAGGAADT